MPVFALLGSGEFLPWARDVDRWAVGNATASSERVLILPTAAAPEGDDVFERWGATGSEHFRAMGLDPQVLPLKTRDDASASRIVDRVADARYIFFSGGNPGYLAETLRGTPFWEAVLDAVEHGTAYGGCSAGATAVGSTAPDVTSASIDIRSMRWVDGLPLFTTASIPTHFDAVELFVPGLRRYIIDARPAGNVLFGIDEDTAACGDGETWTVMGKRAVTIIGVDGDEPQEHFAGSAVSCPLGLVSSGRP